jgi:cytochrome c556
MKILQKTLVMATALMLSGLVAQAETSNPDVKARQDLMGMIAANTKILGEMAAGKVAFDATAAGAAKTALAAAAAEIPAKFEVNVDDPDSEVKANIWTDWAGYTAKAKSLEDAATAIDVASLEGVQAGLGAIGGACKDCHTNYRAKK